MEKGFTLIELLAILVILGVITLVAVPTIISTNKNSKENDYNEFKITVENAAEVYLETRTVDTLNTCDEGGSVSISSLKTSKGSSAQIPLADIVDVGILSSRLHNPKDNDSSSVIDDIARCQVPSGYVTVTNESGKLKYTYEGE